MNYLYTLLGLLLGTTLVSLGILFAAIYTPAGYTRLDTAMTVLTGACLQVGNLTFVATTTALLFDLLSNVVGLRYPVVVPAVVGYVVFHLLLYRSSVSVTRIQETPLDPTVVLSREGLRQVAPARLRSRLGGRQKPGR